MNGKVEVMALCQSSAKLLLEPLMTQTEFSNEEPFWLPVPCVSRQMEQERR